MTVTTDARPLICPFIISLGCIISVKARCDYIDIWILFSNQVQGLEEHFRDSCGGVIKWLDLESSYTAFSEGWGLYAENPLIGEDTDTYKDEPWQKYGMLKWQVRS